MVFRAGQSRGRLHLPTFLSWVSQILESTGAIHCRPKARQIARVENLQANILPVSGSRDCAISDVHICDES